MKRIAAVAVVCLLPACSEFHLASSAWSLLGLAIDGPRATSMPKNVGGANCEFPNTYADIRPSKEACEKVGGKWRS